MNGTQYVGWLDLLVAFFPDVDWSQIGFGRFIGQMVIATLYSANM